MLSSEPIARRAQALMRTMTGYGMTEIGVGVTGSFLDTDEETRVTMSGWPLPGYEVKIIDPASGASLPAGQVGEICVRGYQVMQGYYKKPEETAQTVDPDGWLHTGDSGLLRADGCLRFLGRYKDLLKVGGENVDPTEVESLLLGRPAHQPRRRRRHARPAPVGGAGGVRHPPSRRQPLRGRRRRPSAAAASPASRCPRRVFFVDAFPMTGSGKIQKYLLRERAQQG